MKRRASAIALLALVALLTVSAGCQAELSSTTRISADGSGSIAFALKVDAETDRSFVELTGKGFAENVLLSDVATAGWSIARSSSAGGGSVRITRNFASVDEIEPIVESLNGGSTPIFRQFTVARTSSPAKVDFDFTGEVAISGSNLTDLLDKAVGTDASAALRKRFSIEPAHDLSARVEMSLPGKIDSSDADESADGLLIWKVAPGQSRRMTAHSQYYEWPYLAIAGAGIFCLVTLVFLLAGDLLRRRRRKADLGLDEQ